MATNARQMKMDAITLNPNEGTVLYMREHPTLAAKYLLNVNLNWIQRLAVRNIWTKSFGMLIWGRRNGKTFVGAIACVLRALLFPGERVLIVAPSKRQVDWIFMNEIIPLFNNSGYFRASVNGKINITTSYNRIKFANGSTIEGFPVGTEGGKIRGAGCVVSGTYILTDSGMKKIVDIYKTEKEYKIQTRFGLEDILVYAKNKKKKIKKIITKRGYTLSGLGEHLLLTITDGIKDYKYLSDLKIGDKVCLDIKDKWPDIKYFDCSNIEEKKPRNCPKVTKANNEKPIIFPQYLDENLAVILGYIVSEGSCNQKTVLGMANTDKHVIEDYCSKFEKVFGIKPSVRILSEGVDKRGIKRKITYEASVNRTEIRNFLIDIGLNRAVAKTKSIPFSILESPKSVVISFLRAMYEGDGHARLDSGKYSVGYTTISYELAHTLHVLLSNFGIYGTLRARDRRTKQILNPIKSKNLIYSIDLTGESALKFGRDIGFVTERKNNIINKATVKNSVHRLDDELFYYDEIISIEELEAEFTYDFNIPKEHSYISNGFVSHNCSFLWVDEYAQMSESVINLVFRPMLSVKRKGGYNRYLITSSAYYRWNHMWTLFQYYKIKEFLEPHKYFVLNFNYNHLLLSKNLPVEFDLNIIEEARNNMTENEFSMEYGACLAAGTKISTASGIKNIEDITLQDKVLTHTGSYHNVTHLFKRNVSEEIINIKPYYFDKIAVTKTHKIFIKRDGRYIWEEAQNLTINDYLVYPLNQSEDSIVFDLTKFTTNYSTQVVDGVEYIYPKWSSETGMKNKYAVKYKEQKKITTRYKSSIPRYVKLTPELARFIGYYLAEGSGGAAGKQLNLAFDKKDTNYINDVIYLVKAVFGISGKIYYSKKHNGCSVNFSSRILFDFIKTIIPGNCYTKNVPNFIFNSSNEIIGNLLVGFINGNGCITLKANGKTKDTSVIASVSKQLILDINDLLSKLGIKASFVTRDKKVSMFYKKIINNAKIYVLVVRGQNLQRLLEYFGLSINANGKQYSFVDDKFIYYRIKDITSEFFLGDVYNIEVDKDNSYVANYAIVHNCFPTDIEGFFSSKLIDDCTPKPPDNTPISLELQGDGKSNYYMGIDVGRAEGGSNFSISIIKKKAKVAHLVNVYTMNGATFQDMVETIRRKFVDFNIMKIKLDAGGGGLTIRDLLREQWIDPYTHQTLKPIVTVDDTLQGIPALELVKFTDEIHNSLHMNLKSEMEHGRILFPMDLRRDADKDLERAGIEIVAFKNELRVMTAKPKGKFLRFEVPNKFRTDRVISTALAIDAYIESNRKYEDFDDLAIGSWVSR